MRLSPSPGTMSLFLTLKIGEGAEPRSPSNNSDRFYRKCRDTGQAALSSWSATGLTGGGGRS